MLGRGQSGLLLYEVKCTAPYGMSRSWWAHWWPSSPKAVGGVTGYMDYRGLIQDIDIQNNIHLVSQDMLKVKEDNVNMINSREVHSSHKSKIHSMHDKYFK